MNRRSRRMLWTGAAALVCAVLAPRAVAIALPLDSGAINVRDYGARGDGKTDDTAAILTAIAASHVDQKNVFWPARIVYFPAGTYLISDTLRNRDADGKYRDSMALIGETTASTRLRLVDAAPGFTDPHRPKPMIFAASRLLAGAPDAGGKDFTGRGEGNDAYGNYVEDMTIDAAAGNDGAVGIDFLASNVGAVRHVKVIGSARSGATGISLDRKWPGPLLVSDVTVEGYAIGISISQPEYHVTLQDVRLRGQSRIALRNTGNSVSMRHAVIETDGIPIQNLGPGGLIVVDGLTVSSSRGSVRWADNRGYLVIKDVRRKGRGSGASEQSLDAGSDGAYYGDRRLAGFGADWTLPAMDAPQAATAAPARWASVVAFGAATDASRDASAAIAAAMKSGAEVIYFPSGRYAISGPIDVPASVRRIVGMRSSIVIGETRSAGFATDVGAFRVATGGDPLAIEGLALDHSQRGSQVGVEHRGARTLVLRDLITAGMDIVRGPSGGKLFMENTCCGNLHVIGPAGAWASQLNTEGGGVRIINDGAPLSILGLKLEGNNTAIASIHGARTEVLGGLVYQVNPASTRVAAFASDETATTYLAYTEEAYLPGSAYLDHFRQDRTGGDPLVVHAEDLPLRSEMARVMPGMRIGPAATAPAPTSSTQRNKQ